MFLLERTPKQSIVSIEFQSIFKWDKIPLKNSFSTKVSNNPRTFLNCMYVFIKKFNVNLKPTYLV